MSEEDRGQNGPGAEPRRPAGGQRRRTREELLHDMFMEDARDILDTHAKTIQEIKALFVKAEDINKQILQSRTELIQIHKQTEQKSRELLSNLEQTFKTFEGRFSKYVDARLSAGKFGGVILAFIGATVGGALGAAGVLAVMLHH